MDGVLPLCDDDLPVAFLTNGTSPNPGTASRRGERDLVLNRRRQGIEEWLGAVSERK
jgi:hypothetical protein